MLGRSTRRYPNPALSGLLLAACLAAVPDSAWGYTKESPEVRQLVDKGLAFLEKQTDDRLGGKCVVALAFIKNKKPDHPRVQEAVDACSRGLASLDSDSHIYSVGMAIIFLCEHNASAHKSLIQAYLNELKKRQKANGSWGYNYEEIGDNSQTQYAALALWEAHKHRLFTDAEAVRQMAHWLVRVQDPSGGWSYKGEEGAMDKRVKQNSAEITLSINSAAMGSSLIAGDLFGLLQPGGMEEDTEPLPTGVRFAGQEKRQMPPLKDSQLDRAKLMQAIRDGDAWMNKNYKVSQLEFQLYYMYSLERYKSFESVLSGNNSPEPEWYNNGVEWLKKNQQSDGHWYGGCGNAVDTGFALLFLMRSTLSSLGKSEGTLLSGRGLPARLDSIRLSRGELITQRAQTEVDDLVNLLDEEQSAKLDALLNDPAALVGEINEKNGRRFEQVVRTGAPAARVLAARALGRSGNLDYVPTLIYALTDPDKRVVREARDGLRFISRKFEGFGLQDNYKDIELRGAIERWKQWYLSVRPDAAISLN